MNELERLARGARDVTVSGDRIEVQLPNGRVQRVGVEAGDQVAYRLTSIAVPARVLADLPSPEVRMWKVNRSSALVGFRIDPKGRLVAEAWLPRPGLSAEEFLSTIRRLATEADRVEYLLTGEDVG
jgi:hypothetical protein